MKLHIFQSDKGDCLLLEGADGTRVLCDGGMSSSMKKHVRAELAKLRDNGVELAAVYVSHIDQDHISGVLQLLEDELAWRLFEHHRDIPGGTPIPQPKVPRPPKIHGIWHNAFRDQVGKKAIDIEDVLAAASPPLLASAVPELVELGEELQQIAVSIPEAIKVSRFASPKLLNIPVNKLPGVDGEPKLLMHRDGQAPFMMGSMRFTIVGPTRDELELLKKGWTNFLKSIQGKEQVKRLRAEIKRKVDAFGTESFDLGSWNGIPDFKGVTVPNIASLMFMVEEDGKRILLTGDSQQDIILKALGLAGFLAEGHLHVDVLKVQHHASEHNVDENFCKHVSADHYVFCGNGSDGNPEQSAIRHFFESRVGPAAKRTLAPTAEGKNFKFWFSTTSGMQQPESLPKQTFEGVEELVADLVTRSGGRLSAAFNTGPSITLDV